MKTATVAIIVLLAIGLVEIAYADLIKIGTVDIVGYPDPNVVPNADRNTTITPGGTDYNLIYSTDKQMVWLDYEFWGTHKNVWDYTYDWMRNPNKLTLTYNLNENVANWTMAQNSWRMTQSVGGEGYNKTESDYGYLYYEELGNGAGGGINNTGEFINLIRFNQWSDTGAGHYKRYWFNFDNGDQGSSYASDNLYGMAVADVTATFVPEPISFILFVTGGTLIAGRRFLKKKKTA